MSWTHHWVWDVPLLVWLTTAAWRRQSWLYALIAAAAAAIFSGFLAIPWPGHPTRPRLMAASDQYVLFGLALLAATGIALTRERVAASATLGPAAVVSPGPGSVPDPGLVPDPGEPGQA